MLAALEPEPGVVDQGAVARADDAVLELEHHPPGPLGVAERERHRAPVTRVGLDRAGLDPVDLLQLRLRLARLALLVAEPVDEALEPVDVGLAAGRVPAG